MFTPKKILIIVNPAAGQTVSIIPTIQKVLQLSDISYRIQTTQKENDAETFVRAALANELDAVAVYGGDGTVMECARALMNTDIPLYILPGGTANIMAKELQIPLFLDEALHLLVNEYTQIRTIDMGLVNDIPFLLRVSIGSMADMIIDANPQMKVNFGQLAYSVAAVQKLAQSQPSEYTITIDGKKIIKQGITLVIANSGNIGFSGIPFIPSIKVDDGYLDILLLKNSDLLPLASAVGEAILYRSVRSDTISHWKIKKTTITVDPIQQILCDDAAIEVSKLTIEVVPKALQIAVPGN